MKHFCHDHSLVLNDRYIARQGDVCFCCREEMVSCRSYIYSCSSLRSTTDDGFVHDGCAKFLLHKTCANLPESIENPTNHKEFLVLCSDPRKKQTLFQQELDLPGDNCHCNICDMQLLYGYCNSDFKFCLCLKCAMFQAKELTITHVAHPQHSLALIHRPSSFKCDACGLDENIRDMSYKCQTCRFWIHKSCADAPNLLSLFQSLHDHPLILFYGRPQRYHTYNQWCGLCTENISQLDWFYKCRDQCTYFTHFRCARSRCIEYETYDSNLCHLPAADESSLNLLVEQFLKLMVNNNFSAEDRPYEHWSHKHPLQLITHTELNNQKEDDRIVLLCDGCVKPIRTDGDLFYSCVLCKYFLHKVCAEIPHIIEMDLPRMTLTLNKFQPIWIFCCFWCGVYSNGFFINIDVSRDFIDVSRKNRVHIGCTLLPKTIKHEAHRHHLHQVYLPNHGCNACGRYFEKVRMHRCEQCEFYLCQGCSMKARTVTHPWDPHPLHLRYDAGMVMNHDYEFNCEFCSEEINTNFWFYHCSDCDLSFHLGYCFEKSSFRYYSNVKFGHTDIYIRGLHHHSLKFVLNKKVRNCQECHKEQLGKPVLECAPCKAIFCTYCSCRYVPYWSNRHTGNVLGFI